jgi:hypothetical protein
MRAFRVTLDMPTQVGNSGPLDLAMKTRPPSKRRYK